MVKYVPGRGFFRAVPSQNGDKFATPPTPRYSFNVAWEQDFIMQACSVEFLRLWVSFTQGPVEKAKTA